MPESRKIYFVDTSSLIDTPECLEKLAEGGNITVLTNIVIEEIDDLVKRENIPFSTFKAAINAIENWNSLQPYLNLNINNVDQMLRGKKVKSAQGYQNLKVMPNNGILVVQTEIYESRNFPNKKRDNLILGTCEYINNTFPYYKTTLITEDNILYFKANSVGLAAEHLRMKAATQVKSIEDLPPGVMFFDAPQILFDKFNESDKKRRYIYIEDLLKYAKPMHDAVQKTLKADAKTIPLQQPLSLEGFILSEPYDKKEDIKFNTDDLLPNMGIVLYSRHTKNIIPLIANLKDGKLEQLIYSANYDPSKHKYHRCNFFGYAPADVYQLLFIENILNPNVNIVFSYGLAGTGKTRLAVAAACYLLEQNDYLKTGKYPAGLSLLRPEVVATMEIGFLPGDADKKTRPFIEPMLAALKRIGMKEQRNIEQELKRQGRFNIESTTFLRGADIEDSIVICDEAQNGDRHFAELYFTRPNDSSKVIVLGDPTQFDNRFVRINNNALTLGIFAHMQEFKETGWHKFYCGRLYNNYRGEMSKIGERIKNLRL